MSGIVWLASYPKSGNTWLRAFLANYQSKDRGPVSINHLDSNPSNRAAFDDLAGIEASDCSNVEIDCLRPEIHRYLAKGCSETLFWKTHDAFTLTPNHEPLIPISGTRGAIYIIRNPLDVAISFAHHFNISVDEAIRRMGNDDYAIAETKKGLHIQLRQRLLSWSGHVCSWVDQQAIPVCIIRYEDMYLRPAETFGTVLRFVGIDLSEDRLNRALSHSSFAALREQEKSRGFKERSPNASVFFRTGQTGSWVTALTPVQINKISDRHALAMSRFSYLNSQGTPVLTYDAG